MVRWHRAVHLKSIIYDRPAHHSHRWVKLGLAHHFAAYDVPSAPAPTLVPTFSEKKVKKNVTLQPARPERK